MPEYLAPGVYTEEISTGPVPIEGVSTSTTGMAGPTPRGPVRPRLVTSWLEFQLWYGGLPNPASPFAYTVWAAKGFFDNGGQRLYMARICGDGAAARVAGPGGSDDADDPVGWPGRPRPGQLFVRVAPTQRTQRIPTRPGPGADQRRVLRDPAADDPLVDPLQRDQASLRDPNRRDPDLLEDFDNLLATDIEPVLHGSTLITAAFAAGPPALPTHCPFHPARRGQRRGYSGPGRLRR